MDKPKKKRAPWTDERRANTKAARAKSAEKNRQETGYAYTAEGLAKRRASMGAAAMERRDNSKAARYVPELMHFILTLVQAEKDQGLFDALNAAHLEMEIRWDRHHQHILFSFSTNSLRPEYGILAEQMFRRLFQCYQPGGFSTKTGAGFKSVWRLNKEALNVWLIASQTKEFTVSKAFQALMNITEDRRCATEFALVESTEREGLKELVGSGKKMLTPKERKAVLETRRQLVAEMRDHNERQMADWKKTG